MLYVDKSDSMGEVFYKKEDTYMPLRTHQPKKARRAKKLGFRARMATKAGKLVVKSRRAKGRARIGA